MSILVTGPPRGGTTWVGRVVASSPSIAYLHEPFNPNWYVKYRPGICSVRFPHWYTYVDEANESEYMQAVQKLLNFQYEPLKKIHSLRTVKDAARLIRDSALFVIHRNRKRRALIKDPNAIFSAEWLATKFDMKVVVLIRHPAAFVGSIKARGWKTDFTHFLRQERLMELHLHRYRTDIEAFADGSHGVIEGACLLWRLVHAMILKYRQMHPDWLFLRHEDLSRSPSYHFSEICGYLDMTYSDTIRNMVSKTSHPSNPHTTDNAQRHSIYRNSRGSVKKWQQVLLAENIEQIKKLTYDLWPNFYTEDDWVATPE